MVVKLLKSLIHMRKASNDDRVHDFIVTQLTLVLRDAFSQLISDLARLFTVTPFHGKQARAPPGVSEVSLRPERVNEVLLLLSYYAFSCDTLTEAISAYVPE